MVPTYLFIKTIYSIFDLTKINKYFFLSIQISIVKY